MENRYKGKLRVDNQKLIEILPASATLAISTAAELKKIENVSNLKILDVGIGEGNFAEYLFEYNPEIKIDGVDISSEMIESAREKLSGKNVNLICEDGLKYLRNFDGNYDVIVSSWTIHNFKWKEKIALFKEIYSKLSFGGKMLLMDKIYPDDEFGKEFYLVLQNKRYANCLSEDLAKNMLLHEYQDFSDDYRMDEAELIKILKEIGFQNIRIVDRVEREAVLVAEK